MRGAAFLSGVQDAIVIDIGGTTTDVGVLKGGFPRQAATRVKVNVFHSFLQANILRLDTNCSKIDIYMYKCFLVFLSL